MLLCTNVSCLKCYKKIRSESVGFNVRKLRKRDALAKKPQMQRAILYDIQYTPSRYPMVFPRYLARLNMLGCFVSPRMYLFKRGGLSPSKAPKASLAVNVRFL